MVEGDRVLTWHLGVRGSVGVQREGSRAAPVMLGQLIGKVFGTWALNRGHVLTNNRACDSLRRGPLGQRKDFLMVVWRLFG